MLQLAYGALEALFRRVDKSMPGGRNQPPMLDVAICSSMLFGTTHNVIATWFPSTHIVTALH